MTAGGDQRMRFPDLDPEPPPRTGKQRIRIIFGVAAAALVTTMVLYFAVHESGSQGKAASGGGPGVIFTDGDGNFGVAAPNGSGSKLQPSLGTHGNHRLFAVSPDSRYVMVSDGAILAINGVSVHLESQHIPFASSDLPAGFAGDDHYAVVVNPGSDISNPNEQVSLIDWQTGRTTGLGVSDAVSPDPQTAGVFAGVAGPSTKAGSTTALIQLRRIGHPATTLVTAAMVNRDLGEATDTPVFLSPMPDDNGNEVAVAVTQPTSNEQSPVIGPGLGVVVLSRSGQLIASLRGGPIAGYGVSWSPDGQSLAFFAPAGAFSDVAVWTPSVSRPLVRLISSGAQPSHCIWAASGMQILCQTVDESSGTLTWYVANAGGGAIATENGPGDAVTWISPNPKR